MDEVRRYRLSVHDENWHQIWREDGEGRELPYCEIVNTDKETSEEITKALNDYAALAARVQELEQLKSGAQGEYLRRIESLRKQIADMTRERDEAQQRSEAQGRVARLQEAMDRIITIRNDPHPHAAMGKVTDMWKVAVQALRETGAVKGA